VGFSLRVVSHSSFGQYAFSVVRSAHRPSLSLGLLFAPFRRATRRVLMRHSPLHHIAVPSEWWRESFAMLWRHRPSGSTALVTRGRCRPTPLSESGVALGTIQSAEMGRGLRGGWTVAGLSGLWSGSAQISGPSFVTAMGRVSSPPSLRVSPVISSSDYTIRCVAAFALSSGLRGRQCGHLSARQVFLFLPSPGTAGISCVGPIDSWHVSLNAGSAHASTWPLIG